MSRSLEERVADLDRGIRAQLRARAIPQRQAKPESAQVPVVTVPALPVKPAVPARKAIDWTDAPIARFVRMLDRRRRVRS